ncbi:TIGR03086 family metal-binding protein [Streptomyces sp. NPDC058045]|uniref:TIGR03086 family metal-binding protein n=1 Tax=Streptomyces sp. NPDC058045 TaxID=3346311 RepID=UPI0036E2192C
MTETTGNGPTPAELLDLRPQAAEVARLARAVGEDRLTAPTCCPGMSVGTLLAHLEGLATAFRDAAHKDLGPTTDTPPDSATPELGPDWRRTLPERLEELALAWRAPEAWTGQTRAGGVPLPGQVAGLVAADELVVHGWDLARATGQPYTPDEAALAAAHGLLAGAAEDGGSLFGPPVPVPDGAPLLDRAIGLSGRDPHWTPTDG